MTLPASQPLPALQILSEVARLHWQHVLLFLAAAVLYAIPAMLILTPLAETLVGLQGQQMPTQAQMELLSQQGLVVVLVIPLLTAALFWFWVRLTLMGPRAGLRGDGVSNSLMAVLRIAGQIVVAVLAAVVGVFPLTLLLGLLPQNSATLLVTFFAVTFSVSLSFAIFSRRLVELALEMPRTAPSARPPIAMESHLRLAALFTATTIGLYLIQTIVSVALGTAGAVLSVQVATGILSTATVTVYASIHAIVYRLRNPPASLV